MELGKFNKVSELPVQNYGVYMSMLRLYISLWGVQQQDLSWRLSGVEPRTTAHLWNLSVKSQGNVLEKFQMSIKNPMRFCNLISNFIFAHKFHKMWEECASQGQVWAARELVSIMGQILLTDSEFRCKNTCFFWKSLYLSVFSQGNRNMGLQLRPEARILGLGIYNFAAYGQYYESVPKLILMPAEWSLHKFLFSHISLAGSFTYPLFLEHDSSEIRPLRWADIKIVINALIWPFFPQIINIWFWMMTFPNNLENLNSLAYNPLDFAFLKYERCCFLYLVLRMSKSLKRVLFFNNALVTNVFLCEGALESLRRGKALKYLTTIYVPLLKWWLNLSALFMKILDWVRLWKILLQS